MALVCITCCRNHSILINHRVSLPTLTAENEKMLSIKHQTIENTHHRDTSPSTTATLQQLSLSTTMIVYLLTALSTGGALFKMLNYYTVQAEIQGEINEQDRLKQDAELKQNELDELLDTFRARERRIQDDMDQALDDWQRETENMERKDREAANQRRDELIQERREEEALQDERKRLAKEDFDRREAIRLQQIELAAQRRQEDRAEAKEREARSKQELEADHQINLDQITRFQLERERENEKRTETYREAMKMLTDQATAIGQSTPDRLLITSHGDQQQHDDDDDDEGNNVEQETEPKSSGPPAQTSRSWFSF